MPKILRFALIGLLLGSACSRKPSETVTLQFEIPSRQQLNSRALLNQNMSPGRDIPTEVTDFDCLAINVVGPGITESGEAPARGTQKEIENGSFCTYPGVMSQLVPAVSGGTVELKVPAGPARIIQVLGLISPNGCGSELEPRSHFNRRPSALNDPEFPGIFEVGRSKQDLYNNTTIDISNSYDPNELKEVRCTSACTEEMKANSPFATASSDGTPASPHFICTGAQLQQVSGHLGSQFQLLEDIDLTGITFAPLGDLVTRFSGVFDGNGHKIKGYSLVANSATPQPFGIFGVIDDDGEVSGVRIVDANFSISGGAGVRGFLAGQNYGAIKHCSASGTISSSSFAYTGLLVGQNLGTIEHSSASGTISKTISVDVGLLAGQSEGTITDTFTSGTVTVTSGSGRAGGLVGRLAVGGSISRGVSTATVSSVGTASGLGGLVGSMEGGSLVESCRATGSVSSGGSSLGGLVGEVYASTIQKSVAKGNVSGSFNVGGLVGFLANSTVTESAAFGTISSTDDSAGGLVGHFYQSGSDTTAVTNCAAYGPVSGSGSVGTLIGEETASSTGIKTVSLGFSPWAPASPTSEGLIGSDDPFVTHSSLYANGDLSPITAVSGETRIPAGNLKTQSFYAGFDFTQNTGIWTITEGVSFPTLRSIPSRQTSRAALPTNRHEAGTP